MKRRTRQGSSYKPKLEKTLEIAHIAAKILAEEGIDNYLLAKQRAVRRLQLPENSSLPTNAVVQQCLLDYLEIFDKKGLLDRQLKYRAHAIKIMSMLDSFQPHAVGSVVDGIISKYSRIQIHVFAPTPEDVAVSLINQNIPYKITELQVRFNATRTELKPVYNFLMGDIPVDLFIFSENERGVRTLNHINSRPEIRLNTKSLLM